MSRVNLKRLGGLYWVRDTGGRLSAADRRRMWGKLAKGSLTTLMQIIPRPIHTIDDAEFDPPDSQLANQAEKALYDLGPGHDAIVGHSYRSWMFGLALAHFDKAQSKLDPESFYCAALLHDYGLTSPTLGQDFTRAGSDRAIACARAAGKSLDYAEAIGDAICVHATPGISVDRDGALGYYLQLGSMADIRGFLRSHIATSNQDKILRLHPPGDDFDETLRSMIHSEAQAVPLGRFAWLVRRRVLG